MKNAYSEHGNKNRTNVFRACVSVACTSLLLAACGQSGSLYIPNTPEAAQRSTIGDVLTKPTITTTAPAPSSAPAVPATPAPAK